MDDGLCASAELRLLYMLHARTVGATMRRGRGEWYIFAGRLGVLGNSALSESQLLFHGDT